MLDPEAIPTRRQVAAVFCKAYGAFLMAQAILTTLETLFYIFVRVAGWRGIFPGTIGGLHVAFGILLFVLADTIGGEISGEVELADRRPIQVGDLFFLGLSFFGLYCLLGGSTMVTFKIVNVVINGGHWSDSPTSVLPNLLYCILGFALAFHQRLLPLVSRHRKAPPSN